MSAEQTTLGPAEHALLGLLLDKPHHGYELTQSFAVGTILGEICHLQMSQLYAFLTKLERHEYISATVVPQGVRPPKKIYAITPAGREEFLAWVRTPVAAIRDIRLAFLVKLYFCCRLDGHLPLELIERQLEISRLHLARFKAEEARVAQLEPTELAIEFVIVLRQIRIKQTAAIIEWLEQARQRFSSSPAVSISLLRFSETNGDPLVAEDV